jgi:WD40 repeat protein
MKTSITSNLRPLLRALCPFLFAIAALSAMPRNVDAQLYVIQRGVSTLFIEGVVSKYNATTGEVIDTFFIKHVDPFSPVALAIKDNALLMLNRGVDRDGFVSKFDVTTGATIIFDFSGPFINPVAFALSDNTLFVANFGVDHGAPGTSAVSKCNATTGEVINPRFITGLTSVSGIAVSANLLINNRLYVADSKDGTVGKYNATTGEEIKADFIKGLTRPESLALLGNKLFVVNFGNDTIGVYDAKTGQAINASFINGLNAPVALTVSGNTLFVSNHGDGTVGKYDAKTGAAINDKFIAGLSDLYGVAAKPAK